MHYTTIFAILLFTPSIFAIELLKINRISCLKISGLTPNRRFINKSLSLKKKPSNAKRIFYSNILDKGLLHFNCLKKSQNFVCLQDSQELENAYLTLRSTLKPTFRFIIIRNLHQAKRKVGGGFGIMITALFVVFTTPLKDGMFIGVLRVLFCTIAPPPFFMPSCIFLIADFFPRICRCQLVLLMDGFGNGTSQEKYYRQVYFSPFFSAFGLPNCKLKNGGKIC